MQSSSQFFIANKTKKLPVCALASVADTFWSRLRGLLGQREMHEQSGLLIRPSSGIHTFGMKFAIDVVALDQELRVLDIWTDVKPGHIRMMPRSSHSVLELKSGRSKDCHLDIGDQLILQDRRRL